MIFGTQLVLHDHHHGILYRMFLQETITEVHLCLDCLNFNCCLVGNPDETHLSTLKVLRSNCKFQTPDKYCRQSSSAIINQSQNTQFL